MIEKLKTCPFCGNANVGVSGCKGLEECANFDSCESESYVAIVCNVNKGGCGASSGYHESRDKAIEAWNRCAEPSRGDVLTDLPKECRYCVNFGQDGTDFYCIAGHTFTMFCDGENFKPKLRIAEV